MSLEFLNSQVNVLHDDIFYFPCTLKIKKAIALQSRQGFFGAPCTMQDCLAMVRSSLRKRLRYLGHSYVLPIFPVLLSSRKVLVQYYLQVLAIVLVLEFLVLVHTSH